jgi:DNA-binding beta-propeller fold protein YncE
MSRPKMGEYMNSWKCFFWIFLASLALSGCGKNLLPTHPSAAASDPSPTTYPYKTSIATLDPEEVGVSSDASYVFADLFAGTKVFVIGPYGMPATWSSFNSTPYNDIFGISIAPNGSVYLLDGGNPYVYEYSLYGSPVTSWSGYGGGTFLEPCGIAVAPQNGNVYVADMGNQEVEEFSSQGASVTEWAFPNQPLFVAVSPVSPYDTYVVERNSHVIHEFSSTGNPVTQWGSEAVTSGVGGGTFAGIQGIAVSPQGNVFVTDGVGTCQSGSCTDHLVQEFSPHGTFLAQWGGSGTAAGDFGVNGGPGSLTFDGKGDLYVADPDGARVEVFGP